MNIEDTKAKIAVMQAFADGKAVQFIHKTSQYQSPWIDAEDPSWSWQTYNYRIKPGATAAKQTSETYSVGGLSKREYFAAMAMQGILAGLPESAAYDVTEGARTAVLHADALLYELERTK